MGSLRSHVLVCHGNRVSHDADLCTAGALSASLFLSKTLAVKISTLSVEILRFGQPA